MIVSLPFETFPFVILYPPLRYIRCPETNPNLWREALPKCECLGPGRIRKLISTGVRISCWAVKFFWVLWPFLRDIYFTDLAESVACGIRASEHTTGTSTTQGALWNLAFYTTHRHAHVFGRADASSVKLPDTRTHAYSSCWVWVYSACLTVGIRWIR